MTRVDVALMESRANHQCFLTEKIGKLKASSSVGCQAANGKGHTDRSL